jgi:hypothetical protein
MFTGRIQRCDAAVPVRCGPHWTCLDIGPWRKFDHPQKLVQTNLLPELDVASTGDLPLRATRVAPTTPL